MTAILGWVVIGLGVVACEVAGRALPGMPAFTDLLAACTASRARRVALAGVWIVLGWHLFVQPPRV